jgi:hypothetical protein
MNDKTKNIISNLLGLLISIASVFALVYDKVGVVEFTLLIVIGLALFLFKAAHTVEFLEKIINKKL